MKFLYYTGKLAKKIRFYDKLAQKSLKNMTSNPFFRLGVKTVIWIDDKIQND